MFSIASSSPGVSSRPNALLHHTFGHVNAGPQNTRNRSSNAPGGWTGRASAHPQPEEDPDHHQNTADTAGGGKVMTALEMAENERRHTEDAEDIDQLRKILDSNNRTYLKGLLRDRHYPAQRIAVRQYLWKRMLKVLAGNREADVYQEMKRQLYPDGPPEAIAGMLPRFVDLDHVTSLPYASRIQLSHAACLLHMLAESRPDITYAPLLLPLMLLFLKALAEEDAFDLLYALVVDRHHARLPQTLTACHVQACVLERLASKYLKPFYASLIQEAEQSHGGNGTVVRGDGSAVQKRSGESDALPLHHLFIHWHWWLFEYLPIDYTLVIVDSYLTEGIKLLFRAGLAILALYGRANSKNKEALRNFPETMREFCKKFDVDVDRFYKVMLSFRAFSGARMEKYFRLYEREVANRDLAAEVDRNASGSVLAGKPSQTSAVQSPFLTLIPPLNSMLTRDHLMCIYGWLPARIQLCKPLLVFTTAVDGTSLTTFYSRCDRFEPILLLIKTVGNPGLLFGAYCSTAWAGRAACPGSYFGTGESFLFRLAFAGQTATKYVWAGEGRPEAAMQVSHMFQMGNDHSLQIGGGSGTGLCLSDPLTSGFSERCETFNNVPLAGDKQRDFEIHTVEAYAFQP